MGSRYGLLGNNEIRWRIMVRATYQEGFGMKETRSAFPTYWLTARHRRLRARAPVALAPLAGRNPPRISSRTCSAAFSRPEVSPLNGFLPRKISVTTRLHASYKSREGHVFCTVITSHYTLREDSIFWLNILHLEGADTNAPPVSGCEAINFRRNGIPIVNKALLWFRRLLSLIYGDDRRPTWPSRNLYHFLAIRNVFLFIMGPNCLWNAMSVCSDSKEPW